MLSTGRQLRGNESILWKRRHYGLLCSLQAQADVWDQIDWRSQWEEPQVEAGLMPASSQNRM